MKKLYLLTLTTAMLLFSPTAFAATIDFLKIIKNDYAAKADSLTHCLVTKFMNPTTGVFNPTPNDRGPGTCYWQQAPAIEVIATNYERNLAENTKLATTYKNYMAKWVGSKAGNYNSNTSFVNPFTDDMCWIALALMHMSEVTGNETYFKQAKDLYDRSIITRLKEDERGQWLPWNSYNNPDSGPNGCTEGPACLIAAKLQAKYGSETDQKYLNDAIIFHTFMTKYETVKPSPSDYRLGEPPLTYVQGVFAEACRVLYGLTKKAIYKTHAEKYLDYVRTSGRCTTNQNLLRDEGPSMDQSIFKAIYVQYAANFVLDESMSQTPRVNTLRFLINNADALWKNLDQTKYPAMYCGFYWGDKWNYSQTASMGAMVSGCTMLEQMARMKKIFKEREEAAGVDDVTMDEIHRADGQRYNLQGIKVGNDYKGIYVVNGKKVLGK